ncbi:uncharacterized protein LOC110462532 [Mizuhopecten yessoensis]|uniref:Tox-ART-HYD1 domain-containing protein n=1 Tax=Mizuhopecten yessoensis TaxID=6573 RepID=A0A210PY38_MIZYE|nr:uncharacterized protein LOC110462532 [Mizuhopecten yessoensis]OWF41395.1 hypothetical protein KP79_PYT08416 [Mizuhopecten yessoensis]
MAGEQTQTLYHHTTKEGANGILKSGHIKESTDMKIGAVYGPGVYMTSYGPEKSQEEIALNNYGNQKGIAIKILQAGKTDAIIAIDIPISQVDKVNSIRDIYIANGNVTLRDKKYSLYVRDVCGNAIIRLQCNSHLSSRSSNDVL